MILHAQLCSYHAYMHINSKNIIKILSFGTGNADPDQTALIEQSDPGLLFAIPSASFGLTIACSILAHL